MRRRSRSTAYRGPVRPDLKKSKGQNVENVQGVDRGGFLRFCGVGAVGAALLTSGTQSLVGVRQADAQSQATASPGSLRQEFETASSEYGVPAQILMAIGYVNTRWEMPPIEYCEYVQGDPEKRGVHGLMGLVENPLADTLGIASRLTGIPRYTLKTDRFSNIRGGAALLTEAIRLHEEFSSSVEGNFNKYLEAIAGDVQQRISAFTGIGGGMMFARQVLDLMHSGASLRISSGEYMVLEGGALRRLGNRVESQLGEGVGRTLESSLGRYGSGR